MSPNLVILLSRVMMTLSWMMLIILPVFESEFDCIAYRRMPCMAHTLQLVIKKLYGQQYEHLISKTRALVGKIRKSSKAVESLVEKCGNTVISDNSTRWNSSYYMIRRLLKIKVAVNEVLSDMKVDSLLLA